MTALPEWLWPLEDEEAVQEAERLIEETHKALRRMEADMSNQRSISQNLSEKTEKLKCALNTKIQTLEQELKGFTELSSDQHGNEQPIHITHPTKDMSRSKENLQLNHLKSTKDQLSTHQKYSRPKKDMNTAEKVVLTAREKVEDALSMARNVSASLNQHLSTPSVVSRPLTLSQTNNIGIFEVKSKSDERSEQISERRLKQAQLPSISIKRNLDLQTIPSIQVSPGEKYVMANVSVSAVKHIDKSTTEADQQPEDSAGQERKELFSTGKHQPTICTPSELESTINQLAKQLAQVEELREVNQAQVNHVLQFLLSRVCSATQPPDRPNNLVDDQTKEDNVPTALSPASTMTSSSNSRSPIAYDSLSRFLETYKKAAEQNMLARKRAVSRKKKLANKREKDIQEAHLAGANHLLIGPFRHTSRLDVTSDNSKQNLHQNINQLNQASGVLLKEDDISVQKDSDTDSILENSTLNRSKLSFRVDSISKSPNEISRDGVFDSFVNLPQALPEGITGDEYEDDWEEEEDHQGQKKQDDGEVEQTAVFSKPILVSNSSDDPNVWQPEPTVEVLENEMKTLDLPQTKSKNVEYNEKGSSQGKQSICGSQPTISLNASSLVPMNDGKDSSNMDSNKVRQPFEGKSVCVSQQNGSMNASPQILRDDEKDQNLVTDVGKILSPTPNLEESNFVEEITKPTGTPLYQPTTENVAELTEKVNVMESNYGAHYTQDVKTKQCQVKRKRNSAAPLCLEGSSSDSEMNQKSRSSVGKPKRWDLKLREDLQLQSAILLNWQLEDRWRSRNRDMTRTKDQATSPSQNSDALADIQQQWQRTLDKLDQRLESIEASEKIHRELNELRLKAQEDLIKASVMNPTREEVNNVNCTRVPVKNQMVQTSPGSNEAVLSNKEMRYPPQSSIEILQQKPFMFLRNGIASDLKGRHQPLFSQNKEDLTAELLSFGQMGKLGRLGSSEQSHAKSPSSSTTSSQQQSSLMVSWSDGELRESGNGSCSCSEGEFCLCGDMKLDPVRSPPDGSQAYTYGDHVLKDMSQGEIFLSESKDLVRDTSHGEIADPCSKGGNLYHGYDMNAEESIASDGSVWELRK